MWLGDRKNLELYAGLLKSIVSQQPRAMEVIPEADRDRFLYVFDCFTNNIDPVPWKQGPREPVRTVKVPEPLNEAHLQRMIAFDGLLPAVCGHPDPVYIQLEASAGDGKVDISFLAGRTVHAVELKVSKADHRVVGQIQKYMRALGGQVHYNVYDNVAGWVVAPEFDPETARELSEIGVSMVRLSYCKPRQHDH